MDDVSGNHQIKDFYLSFKSIDRKEERDLWQDNCFFYFIKNSENKLLTSIGVLNVNPIDTKGIEQCTRKYFSMLTMNL